MALAGKSKREGRYLCGLGTSARIMWFLESWRGTVGRRWPVEGFRPSLGRPALFPERRGLKPGLGHLQVPSAVVLRFSVFAQPRHSSAYFRKSFADMTRSLYGASGFPILLIRGGRREFPTWHPLVCQIWGCTSPLPSRSTRQKPSHMCVGHSRQAAHARRQLKHSFTARPGELPICSHPEGLGLLVLKPVADLFLNPRRKYAKGPPDREPSG